MRRVAPIDLVMNGPGHFAAGRTWLYAAMTETEHAYALHGSPTDADIAELLALFDESYGRMAPHSILTDVRDLAHVELRAFARFQRYMMNRSRDLSRIVTRAVILLSPSLAGTLASGFFQLVTPPFAVTTETEARDAFSSLGWNTKTIARYETARGDALGSVRQRLEAFLSAHAEDATLASAARALGVSPRSLQRRLREENTTYARELSHARMAQAEALLRETDRSIIEIALTLGFATPETFAAAFRAHAGMSASAYRKQNSR